MVQCQFQGDWAEQVPDILAVLLKDPISSPMNHWYRLDRLRDMSEEDYKVYVETDEFKNLKYFGSEQLTMAFEDFVNIRFEYPDNYKLRSDRQFKIKVSQPQADMFKLIEAHTELMNKQFKQLSEFSTQTFNEKCGVPNYDGTMLRINQVMLLENCCSDELQETIAQGWRIIAVSPQPDQRRPDYIMGARVDTPIHKALRSVGRDKMEIVND